MPDFCPRVDRDLAGLGVGGHDGESERNGAAQRRRVPVVVVRERGGGEIECEESPGPTLVALSPSLLQHTRVDGGDDTIRRPRAGRPGPVAPGWDAALGTSVPQGLG